jgi:hypothetical protein
MKRLKNLYKEYINNMGRSPGRIYHPPSERSINDILNEWRSSSIIFYTPTKPQTMKKYKVITDNLDWCNFKKGDVVDLNDNTVSSSFIERTGHCWHARNPIEFNSIDIRACIKQLPDWFQEITERPPIGVMPLRIHREERLRDLREAIIRYECANKPIPPEWIAEKQTLEGWLQETTEAPKEYNKEDMLDLIYYCSMRVMTLDLYRCERFYNDWIKTRKV